MSKATDQEPRMITEIAEIQYPAAVRYFRNMRSSRTIRIERPEHIALALHRLAGVDTPGPRDHLEILELSPKDNAVGGLQMRLSATDLESILG